METPSFVLIGEGRPLGDVAAHILKSQAHVAAVFSDDAASGRLAVASEVVLPGGDIRSEAGLERMKAGEAVWLLSVNNFDHLVPRRVLDRFQGRAVNLHFGLLPAYAGRNAHLWAIRRGEAESGVTVHVMTPEADAGAIHAVRRIPIAAGDTGLRLHMRCTTDGVSLVRKTVDEILAQGSLQTKAQDLSHRHLFKESDWGTGEIDWRQPGSAVHDLVRASNFEPFSAPVPAPWMHLPDGRRLEIVRTVHRPDGHHAEVPGRIVVNGSNALIVCGDGSAVELAKFKLDGKPAGIAEL